MFSWLLRMVKITVDDTQSRMADNGVDTADSMVFTVLDTNNAAHHSSQGGGGGWEWCAGHT